MSDIPNPPGAGNPIDPATAELVRRKSYQVARRARLSRTEREDVEQFLTLLLLPRLPPPDPGAGRRPAFVRAALRQVAANALRYYRAAKRAGPVASLDALLRARADGPECPADPADPADAPGASDRIDRALDVAAAVAELPAELRALAEQLRVRSVAEVARTLGVPRTTLYERLKEIRAAFERRGLDDYL